MAKSRANRSSSIGPWNYEARADLLASSRREFTEIERVNIEGQRVAVEPQTKLETSRSLGRVRHVASRVIVGKKIRGIPDGTLPKAIFVLSLSLSLSWTAYWLICLKLFCVEERCLRMLRAWSCNEIITNEQRRFFVFRVCMNEKKNGRKVQWPGFPHASCHFLIASKLQIAHRGIASFRSKNTLKTCESVESPRKVGDFFFLGDYSCCIVFGAPIIKEKILKRARTHRHKIKNHWTPLAEDCYSLLPRRLKRKRPLDLTN